MLLFLAMHFFINRTTQHNKAVSAIAITKTADCYVATADLEGVVFIWNWGELKDEIRVKLVETAAILLFASRIVLYVNREKFFDHLFSCPFSDETCFLSIFGSENYRDIMRISLLSKKYLAIRTSTENEYLSEKDNSQTPSWVSLILLNI